MFSFLCNSNSVFPNTNNNNRGLLKLNYNGRRDSSTQSFVSIRRKPILISASSTNHSSTTNKDIDTNDKLVSIFINTCGFTERRALYMAKQLELRAAKQESNFALLSNYGFTDIHFHKCLLSGSQIFYSDTINTLKPKLEYLSSIGLSSTELADILSKSPNILTRSLENHIIPSVAFLKTLVHTEANLIKILKRNPYILDADLHKHVAPKIAILQAHGVPDSNITWMLTFNPRTLLQTSIGRFDEVVKHVEEMGFDPSKPPFVVAVNSMQCMKKSVWESKLDACRKWGWSEEDIRMAFMKTPKLMTTSEKKIMKIMDFLVNQMGYDPLIIARRPIFLMFSFEKRITPRCLVLHVLRSNGLVKKDSSLSSALGASDKQFLITYVTKFEEQIPGLLNAYQKNVNSLDLLIEIKGGWQYDTNKLYYE